ncbi:MAG TPA: hypothetical protein VHS32_02030 [Streptosporangiaceae bacterium]|nr:hypothetical protein [Streptosporangiaceae bacterium]
MLRVLGWAALVAAARAAWIHHTDNQNVIRTDMVRDAFAAGQAAERTRAAEAAATERQVAYFRPGPVVSWPDAPDWPAGETPMEEFRERFGRTPEEGPPELAAGWRAHYDATTSEVTFLPPGVEEPDYFEEEDNGGDLKLPAGEIWNSLQPSAEELEQTHGEPEGSGWHEWGDEYGGTSR